MRGLRRSVLLLTFLAAGLLTGCPPPNGPPPPPDYKALSLPRGSVELPALLVGEEEVLSSACFQRAPAREVAAPDALERRVRKDSELSGQLSALFDKYLVRAGLEAGAARTAVEQFKFEATNLRLREVDPAEIRPEFRNQACTQRELGYFKGTDRELVVAALKAKSVRVEITSETRNRLGARLDVALEKMNTELGIGFEHGSDSADATRLSGTDLVFGVRRTSLHTERCQVDDLTMQANQTREICEGRFKLRVEPVTSDRYRLLVTPRTGTTDESLQQFSRQGVRSVSDLHAVWLYLDPDQPMTGSFEGLFVGAGGDGG